MKTQLLTGMIRQNDFSVPQAISTLRSGVAKAGIAGLAIFLSVSHAGSILADAPWPSWRGPTANGVVPDGPYPTEWSADENVRWKIDLPGRGASTPVIANDTLIFTLGVEGENTVWAYDLDGKRKWEVQLGKTVDGKHAKASEANSSPVTDGEHVYVYFKSGDLACLDLNGEKKWQLNLQQKYGKDTLWWDLGTSPILTDDSLVIAVMHSGPSFLVALDKSTGEELWKADRWLNVNEESNQSYTTPTLAGEQLLTLGADHITSHNVKDGRFLWKVGGLNPTNDGYFRSISSPVVVGDLVVCPYARGGSMTAVRLDEDVSDDDRVAWKVDFGSDVPTPATDGKRIYNLGDKGVVTCLNAQDGTVVWEENLPRNRNTYSSSPILADGKLYCVREDGTAFVLDVSGEKPKLLHQNQVKTQTVATPVFYKNRIYLRTFETLFCIE